MRMRRKHEFRPPARRFQRREYEAGFRSRTACKREFTSADRHAMQLGRIIQADEAAFHVARGGELRQHRRQVAAGALHAAGRVQFREEANDHASSLSTAATERKAGWRKSY